MPEWVTQIVGMGGGAVVAYAAIRADIAYMRAKVEDAHATAKEAHVRIDGLLTRRGNV